jgi:hypothetical protein
MGRANYLREVNESENEVTSQQFLKIEQEYPFLNSNIPL